MCFTDSATICACRPSANSLPGLLLDAVPAKAPEKGYADRRVCFRHRAHRLGTGFSFMTWCHPFSHSPLSMVPHASYSVLENGPLSWYSGLHAGRRSGSSCNHFEGRLSFCAMIHRDEASTSLPANPEPGCLAWRTDGLAPKERSGKIVW